MEAANDLDAVRRALGYNIIDLWGVSHGTLLSQWYIALYPDAVRFAYLDAFVPLQGALLQDTLQFRQENFRELIGRCESREICSRRFPNLGGQLRAMLAEDPYALVRFNDSIDSSYDTVPTFAAARVIEMIREALTDSQEHGGSSEPSADDLQSGPSELDRGAVSFFLYSCRERLFSDAEQSNVCGELLPNIDPEYTRQERRIARQQLLTSDARILILSGQDDLLTRAEAAQGLADQSDRIEHVVFPWTGHSNLSVGPRLGDATCAVHIARSFGKESVAYHPCLKFFHSDVFIANLASDQPSQEGCPLTDT